MRLLLSAIAIAASLGGASAAFAQAVDHSAHHPNATAKSDKTPDSVAKPAPASQMQCMGMMEGKMGAGEKGGQAPSKRAGPGKDAEPGKKHCAEMMAKMHGGHDKAAK